MDYYIKYLKYKKKYFDLYGGIIQRNDIQPSIKCTDICFICGEETIPRERIIIDCGCCFHINCLNIYINNDILDRTRLGPNGIICPNVLATTCDNPESNITPDDLDSFYLSHPEIPLVIRVDTSQLRAMLALNASPQSLEQIDPSQIDPYIAATNKRCPGRNCGEGISHYHGHNCHHMKCRNPPCRTEFCYICRADGRKNEEERGINCFCLCPPLIDPIYGSQPTTWSTFCKSITNESDILLYPVPHDKRCGCVFCPDCTPGHPCSTCDGNCDVCIGLIKPGPRELYNPTMGSTWLVNPEKFKSKLIIDAEGNMEFIYSETKNHIVYINITNGNYKLLGKKPQPSKWFDGFNNLHYLILESCKIEMIQKNTFDSITNLMVLKLINNPIVNFPSEIKKLINLHTLEITGSNITTINNDTFVNNTELLHLNLEHNKINNIETYAFRRTNIKYINLYGNKLDSFFIIPSSVVILNLANNLFETIDKLPIEINPRIQKINLSTNKIKIIKSYAFSLLQQLKIIKLFNNPIKKIESSAFNSCPKLKIIEMSRVDRNFQFINNSYSNVPRLKYIRINEINIKK